MSKPVTSSVKQHTGKSLTLLDVLRSGISLSDWSLLSISSQFRSLSLNNTLMERQRNENTSQCDISPCIPAGLPDRPTNQAPSRGVSQSGNSKGSQILRKHTEAIVPGTKMHQSHCTRKRSTLPPFYHEQKHTEAIVPGNKQLPSPLLLTLLLEKSASFLHSILTVPLISLI